MGNALSGHPRLDRDHRHSRMWHLHAGKQCIFWVIIISIPSGHLGSGAVTLHRVRCLMGPVVVSVAFLQRV